MLRKAAIAAAAWALACSAGLAEDFLPALAQQVAGQVRMTVTRHHKPGDPVNVGLVGSRDDIIAAMAAAGWQVPAPVTLRTSAHIVESVALRRAYLNAPVSPLFYLGRKQDLAFEKEVGRSASRRHHVRFWKLADAGPDGRPLWLGAATFDKGVGLSHRSGAVTHHISGDVDAERSYLMDELNKSLRVAGLYLLPGQGPLRGRNGGGDAYWSDGRIAVAVVAPGAAPQAGPATVTTP